MWAAEQGAEVPSLSQSPSEDAGSAAGCHCRMRPGGPWTSIVKASKCLSHGCRGASALWTGIVKARSCCWISVSEAQSDVTDSLPGVL